MAKKKSAKAKPQSQQRAVVKTAPAAVGSQVKGAAKPVITNSDVGCSVTHTEFCFDVTTIAAAGGAVYVEPVNPQRASVFTWLSAMATRFEMYRFRRLKFHYKPSCGSSTDGYVIIAFDFDAYDQPDGPATSATTPSKPELLAWKYSKKCSPWQETTLDVSQDSRISTMRYCDYQYRGDKRLDILGNLVMRAQGTSTKFIGEVFVEYTVEFRQPSYKIPPALYATWPSGVMPAVDVWFPEGSVPTGNLNVVRISNDTIMVVDAGVFLIAAAVGASSGLSAAPTVTASTPSASPSANYTLTNVTGVGNGTTDAVRLAELEVQVPPVLLTFDGTTGSDINAVVRMSTYQKS